LQTWQPPPRVQCNVPASDGNFWFSSWLSLQVLVGSNITRPLVPNKLMGLASGKGAVISKYMAINFSLLPLQVEALIVTPLWPFSNCVNGSHGIIHVNCHENMKLLSSKWVYCLSVPAVTCSLGHGSEIYGATQWDPGILNLVCRATLQISDALCKPCSGAAPAKNGVCLGTTWLRSFLLLV
jgi:hypothetical protein